MEINWTNVAIGVSMTIVGILGVKYTYPISNFTGPQDWLERFTGSGTTYGIMKIFFVVVMLFGILVATGLGDPVLNWVLSPLRNMFRPLEN